MHSKFAPSLRSTKWRFVCREPRRRVETISLNEYDSSFVCGESSDGHANCNNSNAGGRVQERNAALVDQQHALAVNARVGDGL